MQILLKLLFQFRHPFQYPFLRLFGLILDIEGKSQEMPFLNGPWLGEMVVVDRHETDQFRIAFGKGFRQNADPIDEIVGIALLVSEPE